jgi:hypothetical protein
MASVTRPPIDVVGLFRKIMLVLVVHLRAGFLRASRCDLRHQFGIGLGDSCIHLLVFGHGALDPIWCFESAIRLAPVLRDWSRQATRLCAFCALMPLCPVFIMRASGWRFGRPQRANDFGFFVSPC